MWSVYSVVKTFGLDVENETSAYTTEHTEYTEEAIKALALRTNPVLAC